MKKLCGENVLYINMSRTYNFLGKVQRACTEFKIWLIMADFQRIQEKWAISKIQKGNELGKWFPHKQMNNIHLLLRDRKYFACISKIG